MNIQNRITYLLSKGFKRLENNFQKGDIIISIDFIQNAKQNFYSTVNLSLHKGQFVKGSGDWSYPTETSKSVKCLYQGNACNAR